MKFCCTLFVSLCFAHAFAGIHVIQVNQSSVGAKSINANAGDTINWIWVSGKHHISSISVPRGAAEWHANLSGSSPSISIVLSIAGTYNYHCTIHGLPVKGKIIVSGVVQSKIPVVLEKVTTDTAGITIYPQPFKDNLTIDIANKTIFRNPVTIEVFDALGSLKFSKKDGNVLQGSLTVDLSALPGGYYLINISDANNKRTFRVLKTR